MEWLRAQGEMATLIREKDWASTPLGARDLWSVELRTVVNLVLNSHFPKAILWGKDLIFLYNDAYTKIAGNKHPQALGVSTREVGPEAWCINEPIFESVMDGGKSIFLENQPFRILRNNNLEETYFTLNYGPIYLDDGSIGGILVTLLETTSQVVASRRLEVLSNLQVSPVETKTIASVFQSAGEVLSADSFDFPFVLFYEFEPQTHSAKLSFCKGIPAGTEMSPVSVFVDDDGAINLPFAELLKENSDEIRCVDLSQSINSELRARWQVVPTLVVVALRRANCACLGFFVAGIAVGVPWNDGLKRFVRAVAHRVANAASVVLHFVEREAQSKISFELALEAAKGGAWEWNLDTNEVLWSQKTWILHGFEGQSNASSYEIWRNAVLEDDRADAHRRVMEAVNESREMALEYRVTNQYGSMGTLLSRAVPIRDHAGRVIKYLGIVIDISEIKELENNLKSSVSEARNRADELAAMMDTIPALTFIAHDPLSLQMSSSRLVHELLRLPPGANTSLSAPEEERPANFRALKDGREVLPQELPVQRAAATGEKISEYECVLELESGTQYTIFGNAVPILDEFGKPRGAVGSFVDVTKLKKAEAAVRENAAFLQTIVENVPVGIWYMDSTGKIVFGNKAGKEIWAGARYVGPEKFGEYKGWFVDTGKAIAAEEWAAARAIRNGETILNELIEIECFDGSHKIMRNSALPVLQSDGKIIGVIIINADVTDLTQAEEERQRYQKLQSLGVIAGGIAHDFNNIMMGLFGCLSLAKKELSSEHPSYKFIEDAESSMGRAISLTKQLLTFAKGGDPIKERIILSELVEEVVRFDLTGSNVKPNFRKPEDLWSVRADRGQLQQVISNLTINAREAMPRGGVFSVFMTNREVVEGAIPNLQGGRYVEIRLCDEGVGIDARNLARIFEPYFSTKAMGRGLGLATVYSIVKKHGGSITLDSKIGEGTAFTVLLPASLLSVSEQKSGDGDVRSLKRSRAGSMLVLDDEEVIRTLLPRWLKADKWMVVSVADGRQALQLYEQSFRDGKSFDVLLLDLTVPGSMGGQEVLHAILAFDPQAIAIVSSGYADDPVLANFADYGFKAALPKPYTEEQLRAALDAAQKGLGR